MERKIPCVYMRGGTSKACFFRREDLPADAENRDRVLLRVFGSPDAKQIDGMGGAAPNTSKAAIISRSDREDADVDFDFNQVGIDKATVDKNMNCGNISSAVGPYAIDEGLVAAVEPMTVVRIYNRNTEKVIYAHVPVEHGKARTTGDYEIAGVPGTGARVDLEFFYPQGSATGNLLPAGMPQETMEIDGKPYDYSFVDAANPIVFLRPEQFGVAPEILPGEFNALPDIAEIRRRIEIIRGSCAVKAGLAKNLQDAEENSPGLPKVMFCAAPRRYQASQGKWIGADEMDILGRFITLKGAMAPAIAVTGAVCLGVAAGTPGTVVWQILKENGAENKRNIRVGHPCGVMDVQVSLDETGRVKSCRVGRTARRIMEGYVYV